MSTLDDIEDDDDEEEKEEDQEEDHQRAFFFRRRALGSVCKSVFVSFVGANWKKSDASSC